MIPTKGGTGIKMKIQVGYRASTTFYLRVRSGMSLCKTVPENTYITGKVIHGH